MEPTIRQGDHIVADMTYYISRPPQDGDVILFNKNSIVFVKRVIASGGEVIEGKNGLVYMNGKALTEPYVQHVGAMLHWMNDFGPITVPEGEYFVMGDNRDFSLDSRSPDYGTVPAHMVIGKPLFVLYSAQSGRTGKAIR